MLVDAHSGKGGLNAFAGKLRLGEAEATRLWWSCMDRMNKDLPSLGFGLPKSQTAEAKAQRSSKVVSDSTHENELQIPF